PTGANGLDCRGCAHSRPISSRELKMTKAPASVGVFKWRQPLRLEHLYVTKMRDRLGSGTRGGQPMSTLSVFRQHVETGTRLRWSPRAGRLNLARRGWT